MKNSQFAFSAFRKVVSMTCQTTSVTLLRSNRVSVDHHISSKINANEFNEFTTLAKK